MNTSSDSAAHPHDWDGKVPDRLPPSVVRELSQIDEAKALGAVAQEWAMIGGAIALALWAAHPLVTVAAVVFIGARQHALAVIAHDASHHRFLRNRRANDLVANLLCSWPIFASVQGFRFFHGPHHRHTEEEGDGNRDLWKTHDADGNRVPAWTFPKSRAALAGSLAWYGAGPTGLKWLLRGLIGPVRGRFVRGPHAGHLGHLLLWLVVGLTLTAVGGWWAFLTLWILPLITWHVLVQHVRLICEHAEVHSEHPAYRITRSTLVTGWQRWLILPRHIGYHVEHHWYPSVPFYNLPKLHQALMEQQGFRDHVVIDRSVFSALGTVAPAGGAR